jgi:hypothetical protein
MNRTRLFYSVALALFFGCSRSKNIPTTAHNFSGHALAILFWDKRTEKCTQTSVNTWMREKNGVFTGESFRRLNDKFINYFVNLTFDEQQQTCKPHKSENCGCVDDIRGSLVYTCRPLTRMAKSFCRIHETYFP